MSDSDDIIDVEAYFTDKVDKNQAVPYTTTVGKGLDQAALQRLAKHVVKVTIPNYYREMSSKYLVSTTNSFGEDNYTFVVYIGLVGGLTTKDAVNPNMAMYISAQYKTSGYTTADLDSWVDINTMFVSLRPGDREPDFRDNKSFVLEKRPCRNLENYWNGIADYAKYGINYAYLRQALEKKGLKLIDIYKKES